jgi:transposase
MDEEQQAAPGKGGRPTKLTPAAQGKIVAAIQAGNYIETAAAFAGVSKQTLYSWLRRGERARRGIYRDFNDAVQLALAQSEVMDLEVIRRAARLNWTAAAWRLERRYPEKWGRKDKVTQEHTGPGGGPVQQANLTQEQFAEVAKRVAQEV